MRIEVTLRESERGPLGEAALYFDDLPGFKLVGFTIWRSKKTGKPYVSFPAREYISAGEKRYYDFLRVDEGEREDLAWDLKNEILELFIKEYKAVKTAQQDNRTPEPPPAAPVSLEDWRPEVYTPIRRSR